MMDASTAEFYLASIWKYHSAGVDRVLDALRTQHPPGCYAFEADDGWFKVSCAAADVQRVQAIFRQVHDEIEHGIRPETLLRVSVGGDAGTPGDGSEDGDGANPWLRVPAPGDLPNDSIAGKPPVDHLCPASFDRFTHCKVWARVKIETPDTISVAAFLSDEDRRFIAAASGAHVAPDAAGRLIYLGGPTKECLSQASRMLDNLFSKFTFVMPPPKHILYGEGEGACHVDARFMAHVNDAMLTSTLLDPGQYPDEHLASMFRAVFAKAVCLRICVLDGKTNGEVSCFGPRAQPIFNDQARRWPLWFKRAEYAPKTPGAAAGAGPARPAGQPKARALARAAAPVDLLTDDIPSPEKKTVGSALPATPFASPAAATRPASIPDLIHIGAHAGFSEGLCPAPVGLPLLGLGTHGYQMKLLGEFARDPFQRATGHEAYDGPSSAKRKASAVASGADAKSSKLGAAEERGEQLLVDLADDVAAAPIHSTAPFPRTHTDTEGTGLLIEIDAPPPPLCPPSPPPSLQRPSVLRARGRAQSLVKSGSKALAKRSSFANSLCGYIGRLMADLPYSRGRIRLQVELGRIYIMDASAEGLSSNAPDEPAEGWLPVEITTRLDTVCVAPDSIVFTKALTLFANDIEKVIGNAADGAGGRPRDLLSDSGGSSARPPAPDWTLHDKRVVYELKCQRQFLTGTGAVKLQSPFVVEIDGTTAGAFAYSLRRVEDTRPPIWIHCIRRHWDARVSVSYSQTDKLEAAYGDFARELVRTMEVFPRFQVAYDHRETANDGRSSVTTVLSARVRSVGRFQSADRASFLDVSWCRHMALAMQANTAATTSNHSSKPPPAPASLTGTMRFTAADDDPPRGMFGSWYEVSVASAAAEAAFRENETLPAGGMAAWGGTRPSGADRGDAPPTQDEMYEAAFGPALRLVRKMDGVGVLIDNGQGDGLWTPPVQARKQQGAAKFW